MMWRIKNLLNVSTATRKRLFSKNDEKVWCGRETARRFIRRLLLWTVIYNWLNRIFKRRENFCATAKLLVY